MKLTFFSLAYLCLIQEGRNYHSSGKIYIFKSHAFPEISLELQGHSKALQR